MTEKNLIHDKATAIVRAYTEKGKGLESTLKLYDDTADNYDELLQVHDFRSPDILAKAVKELMNDKTDIKILDVCAGTGLSGEALYNSGFRNIDALDGSQGMLNSAEKKGVYGNLFCEMIEDKDLNISKHSYDMATFSGAFQENHLRSTAFKYVIQLVKPGGYIVNVMRESVVNAPWYGEGLEVYMAQLEKDGMWKKISREVVPEYIGSGSGEMTGLIHIYQVL